MKHKSFIIETCEKEIEHLKAALSKWRQRTHMPLNLLYQPGIPETKVKELINRISRFEIIIESLQD